MKGPELPVSDETQASAPFVVHFVSIKPERAQLLEWLREETAAYADPKFDEERGVHDARMRAGGLDEDGWWYLQVFQYVRRAQILGIETPQGRQQLAKCLAALGGCLESVIRVHGNLPEPGHTSGDVQPWPAWDS